MSRAGLYPRREVRRRHWDLLRDRWPALCLLVALMTAAVAVGAVAAPSWLAPYVIGAGGASVVWYLAFAVVQAAGTGSWMLGRDGEEWTSAAVRPLRRRGWALIDHLPLEFGDVDHALVGPGGAFAIESKATSDPWGPEDERLVRAAAQARRAAAELRPRLMSKDIGIRTQVEPVVVVWGDSSFRRLTVDGVQVLHGHELRDWRRSLPSGVLDQDEVKRAESGLMRMVEQREAYERRRHGPSPLVVEIGPLGILNRLATGIAAGMASWVVAGLVLDVTGERGFYPVLGALTLVAALLLRNARLRLVAVGCASATAALWLLILALYIVN